MRSPSEILFRLRQECANLMLATFPPSPTVNAEMAPAPLPSAEQIRLRLDGSVLTEKIRALSAQILNNNVPLLGVEIQLGQEVGWRKDHSRGTETPPHYFRRIPYLDADKVGDHKVIWELNRHQHLVLLAQAYVLQPSPDLLTYIEDHLSSWLKENPFQCGINWASALEVSFRALSWLWILHLVGKRLSVQIRQALIAGLYRHGRHLETNLSIYFSRNTHLLGEAVALHAIGTLLPGLPRAAQWRATGKRLVAEELDHQVQQDGSHFEQSTYYHVYALDMFVFHGVLAGMPAAYREKIGRMAQYLWNLVSPVGTLPLIGDDDGGRLFYPFGVRAGFGRATLATCAVLLDQSEWLLNPGDLEEQAAWWLLQYPEKAQVKPVPPSESRFFANAGLGVMRCGNSQVLIDAGPFGPGSGGHSHSDTLSVVVNRGSEQILVDTGTYTYVGDPNWRNYFRGSAAHNTIRIDGGDQAQAAGPFRWLEKPAVEVLRWQSQETEDLLEAACSYRLFRHIRRCRFLKKEGLLLVEDEIQGVAGDHEIEQWWHPGESCTVMAPGVFAIGQTSLLVTDETARITAGWISDAPGHKREAPAIVCSKRTILPTTFAAVVDLDGQWRKQTPEEARRRYMRLCRT